LVREKKKGGEEARRDRHRRIKKKAGPYPVQKGGPYVSQEQTARKLPAQPKRTHGRTFNQNKGED